MSALNEFPSRCRECAKSTKLRIHDNCNVCQSLDIEEKILCDLNRCVQDEVDFRCYAFRPILWEVGAPEDRKPDSFRPVSPDSKRESFVKLLQSDKIKYERALALQKLKIDPDSMILNLKYHFAWNVSFRKPEFTNVNSFIVFVNNAFFGCSDMVGGFVELIHLAPDHLHLYVESDGELSVEEMAQEIKKSSNNAILKEFPLLGEKFGNGIQIWDQAHFVETLG